MPDAPTPPRKNEFFHPRGTAVLVTELVVEKISTERWKLRGFSISADPDHSALWVQICHHPPGLMGVLRVDPAGRTLEDLPQEAEAKMKTEVGAWLDDLYAAALAQPEGLAHPYPEFWTCAAVVKSTWTTDGPPTVDADNGPDDDPTS